MRMTQIFQTPLHYVRMLHPGVIERFEPPKTSDPLTPGDHSGVMSSHLASWPLKLICESWVEPFTDLILFGFQSMKICFSFCSL